ncbi:5'-3' exoribonuclease 4-like isoform X1 [Miscanthus floridulus]|uniref:5'-3' exoribonuclease 4-like isoform X1 n=2 Tax=Miscanthus floridulus TaxID=154761 RepID=UPI00345B0845
MGIPSFYKWVVNKYPSVISPAKEEPEECPDGIYDNLYVDMNCIIHCCFHPQDLMHADIDVCPPMTVSEVFESMFEYMDRLFRIVRPTRLLYLAVDGVAPCAKMNRVRRGRFHSARLARSEEIEDYEMRKELRAQGKEEPPREISEVSDPNVIAPGTEFMEKLSQALEYYIRARLNSDPWWRDIMVILSDANVPGEGEHKIMSFVRAQRSMEGYDPNTRHCLFGHDADLIMLALASHEVHFSILREDVLLPNQAETEGNPKKPFLFLNIWVLREYLEIEFKILDPVCEPDIERLIDDFIFICFLMGNDFIPHIPSLETHEGAVDLLIEVYKTTFNKMGGYIINTDKVKDKNGAYLEVSRLEIFLHELSMYEEKIFLKRYELEQDLLLKTYHEMLREASESERPELRQKLDDLLFNEERPYDSIRLGLPGWKSRFFREYFGAKTSNEIGKLQNDMAQKYLEGLCWVLQCYSADFPSWSWYYPFYVAPFVSDLKGLSRVEISFILDKPLRPFDQLMAVLPMRSWCALPKCYKEIMGRKEFDYPRLAHDTNGKHFLWNGISEELLPSVTKAVDKELTTHESRRNTARQEKIFLHRDSSSLPHNEVTEQTSHCSVQKLLIDSATSGIGGWIVPADNDGLSDGFFHSPTTNLQDITSDQTISGTFFNPEAANPVPRLLGNVRVPDKTVTGADISKRPLWHTYQGSRPPRIIQRPETLWKPSTPASPREEHKNAGTGWIGRGRGANALAAAQTQLTRSSSYSYRRGGGFHRAGMAQSRGSSSSRFDDDDGAYSFRPLGSAPWTATRDSGRSRGAGHGGIAQPRGW